LNIATIKLTKSTNESGILSVSVDEGSISPSGLVLPISLSDKATGRKITIIGTFASRDWISVLPTIVRLERTPEGALRGTAIVAIAAEAVGRPSKKEDEQNTRSASLVISSVSAETSAAEVDVIQLSDTAARVSLEFPAEVVDDVRKYAIESKESPALSWEIMWGNYRTVINTGFQFIN
jgi:hypothetical protein